MLLYLIPGLSSDRRLFAKLDLVGHQVHFLDWPPMPAESSLADYARRLAARIDAGKPHALVGVSMGGMVAQEMAAITHPERVVIVSSWKRPEEMPRSLRLLRGTHPERILTPKVWEHIRPLARWQMGVERPEEVALFNALVASHSIDQLRIQINACLTWNGPAIPVQDLVHIHGDHDRLMPIDRIRGAHRIHGGSHFMVFNRAGEVGDAVKAALRTVPAPGGA